MHGSGEVRFREGEKVRMAAAAEGSKIADRFNMPGYLLYDVDEFIRKSKEEKATPLSALTEGIHLHTVSANSEEQIDRAIDKLKELGILL